MTRSESRKRGCAVCVQGGKSVFKSSFFMAWAVYCPPAMIAPLASKTNCLDVSKIICALIVFFGVLLYDFGRCCSWRA